MKVVPIKPVSQQTSESYDGQMLALGMKRRFARGAGFGFSVFGRGQFAFPKLGGGVYQGRKTGYNQYTGPPVSNAKRYHVLMREYAPTNPQTVVQQQNRSKFADGVAAWQALTETQQAVYNHEAERKTMSGHNLFLRKFMLSP